MRCAIPHCDQEAEYEAWFKNGSLNQRLNVCEVHVKLSIGYQKNGQKALDEVNRKETV
jgi:hypothetical protein